MSILNSTKNISVRCLKNGAKYGVSFEMKNCEDEAAIIKASKKLKELNVKDPSIYRFQITRTFKLSKVQSNGINQKN